MEIQPPSSVDQATAKFTGLSKKQVEDSIRRIFPYRVPNTLLKSKYVAEAVSSTSSYKDFREKDQIEAHRLLQGVITNPWQSIHNLEYDKVDPNYYDAGLSDITDLSQNLIGKVTGAPDTHDPRMNFVNNLLKLKQFQKGFDNDHSYEYMTNLFLSQVEKGSTYYQTQAQRQQEEMNNAAAMKTTTPVLNQHVLLKHMPMGTLAKPHGRKKRDITISTVPIFAHNPKRAKLDETHEKATRHILERNPHSKLHEKDYIGDEEDVKDGKDEEDKKKVIFSPQNTMGDVLESSRITGYLARQHDQLLDMVDLLNNGYWQSDEERDYYLQSEEDRDIYTTPFTTRISGGDRTASASEIYNLLGTRNLNQTASLSEKRKVLSEPHPSATRLTDLQHPPQSSAATELRFGRVVQGSVNTPEKRNRIRGLNLEHDINNEARQPLKFTNPKIYK